MTIKPQHPDDLLRRALAAWFKTGGGYPAIPQQPSQALSAVETDGGHQYVVLRNVNGVLAAYRVRNDGALKRLVRIPKAFQESAE